jgi:hypothetical protein
VAIIRVVRESIQSATKFAEAGAKIMYLVRAASKIAVPVLYGSLARKSLMHLAIKAALLASLASDLSFSPSARRQPASSGLVEITALA